MGLIRFYFLLFKSLRGWLETPYTAVQKLFKNNLDNHVFHGIFEQKRQKPVNHELENVLCA